ncbi:hypothetical protein ASPBRDRAFT_362153 [Aspergillus brasiliensis CBS 101740]|uniref:DUF3074 domain-containing protein n=1 Tax=Aspergillus brasiliensis (strain CBS 101740 / IMI 381727 / IBT 21946) TaxID=767769 RepID=A0A1L9U4R2_ASPBC|nr:hypothetical protein ASPBRDRAFT_362153 [Aspergillus brasiliensis CBS 101740]
MSIPQSYLHLNPHPFSILPSHPALDDETFTTTTTSSTPNPTRPQLRSFLHACLTESQTLLSSIPTTFRRDRKPRRAPPSTANVHLYTRNDNEKGGDYWVCRQSTHQDAAVTGSASWEEFRSGLRENHSEKEMDYTPSVTSVVKLMEWPSEVDLLEGGDGGGGWGRVDVHVNLITHTFHPTVLIAPRSFLVLVISADRAAAAAAGEKQGFVTVQIPLAVESSPDAIREKIMAAVPRNTVFASYASVEEVVATADGLQWTMATTSDAGGAIPRWIQRSWTMGGVPKAVVADVGLFLGWTARRRS